jgi:hypothetical protein
MCFAVQMPRLTGSVDVSGVHMAPYGQEYDTATRQCLRDIKHDILSAYTDNPDFAKPTQTHTNPQTTNHKPTCQTPIIPTNPQATDPYKPTSHRSHGTQPQIRPTSQIPQSHKPNSHKSRNPTSQTPTNPINQQIP